MILPDSGGGGRTWRLSERQIRTLRAWAWLAAIVLLALGVSWLALAWHATRTASLQAELQAARAEAAQVQELARALDEVEGAYTRLRALFGMAGGDAADMLPPLHGGEGASADVDADTDAPVTWPLTSRGFLTQPLLAGDAGRGRHPGIDVAVPAGSYFRAAGGGTVVEAGWDDVYGWFVRLDHGGGLETLYAHAALLVVREGERVFPGEVLGLTGSTGQSTAPHLHFELLAEGSPVDPLDRLDRP